MACYKGADQRCCSTLAPDRSITTGPMLEFYRTETPALAGSYTLSEAWNLFMEERRVSLCPTTMTSDYRQVTRWLARCPVQDFQEGRKVLIWLLRQEPVKSARRVCMYVKSLYNWAAAEDVGLINRNPLLSFKMPKMPQKDDEIIVIPRNEIPLVLAALEAKKNRRFVNWSLYTEFMLQTAMRTGEVRALRWEDIKDNKILVHQNYTLTHGLKNSTKTNKKRWVPLNRKCLEILNQLPQENQFIFPWERLAFQSFFRNKLKPLHQAQLISHLYRPYDCRHTAISRWIEEGIPVPQIALWAGNTTEVIFKHYCNSTQEYEMPEL